MKINHYYPIIAKIALFLSAFPLFMINAEYLCIATDSTSIIYLTEINGTGGDDGIAFTILAIFSLCYAIIISLVNNKIIYGLLLAIYFIIQYFILMFIESTSALDLIFDSIYYCDNIDLFIWCILQSLFFIGSLCFIFSKHQH